MTFARRIKAKTLLALALAALAAAPAPAAPKAKSKKPKTASLAPVKHDPEAKKLMGEGLGALERGEYSTAISAFNKAVRRQRSVSTYFLLGWAHYQRGFRGRAVEEGDRDDAQSAIDAYTMALQLDPKLSQLPDPARLHFSLALCHEAAGALGPALESYKTAYRLSPKPLVALHAARLRLKLKDPARAVRNIELAVEKAMGVDRHRELRDAVRRDPAFRPLLADAASRRALGIGDAEQDGTMIAMDVRGEELRDSIRDTAPRPVAPTKDPQVLDAIAEGNVQFKARRYLAAVAHFDRALALDGERLTLTPDEIGQLYERVGTAYNKLGQAETAIGALRQALQKSPLNANARYQLAVAYGVSGKTAAALASLKEALAACPTPADLRRVMMQAKTDSELEAVRDQPGFVQLAKEYRPRIAMR